MTQRPSLGSGEIQGVQLSALQRFIDLLDIKPDYHRTVNHDNRGGHEAKSF
jgi:hypothetical protein